MLAEMLVLLVQIFLLLLVLSAWLRLVSLCLGTGVTFLSRACLANISRGMRLKGLHSAVANSVPGDLIETITIAVYTASLVRVDVVVTLFAIGEVAFAKTCCVHRFVAVRAN